MNIEIFSGIFIGFIITISMKYTPIFHGFDSNDVKRVVFTDEKGDYYLVPYEVKCK